MTTLRQRAVRFLSGEHPLQPARYGDLRVATIVDPFTRACLEPECTLLAVDARTWRLQLATFAPQLLFVESTWRGAHDSWKKKVASYPDHHDETLFEVVRYCRRRSIPTVFWNKEDPVHFDRFLATAQHFDHVFTTELACVERYRAAGCARVSTLLFAAQPALHFPPAAGSTRDDVVCFAGSYGEAELGARRTDLEALLDGAVDATAAGRLVILDRQAAAGSATNAFPERFRRFVQPGVDYQTLADLQRRYKVFLNVNAVRDSRTMFSRRVFELLASGAAVVSSPNAGISELFGDVVAIARDRAEAAVQIRRFLADDHHRETVAKRGIDLIAAAHTYAHRMHEVCDAVGLARGPF